MDIKIELTKEEAKTVSDLLKEAYVDGKIPSTIYGPIENKIHLAIERYDRAERLRLFDAGAPCHEACQG